MQAEMIRDVASTKTIGASAGPPASGAEVVVLLERTAAERSGWPLVLAHDNGGPYCSPEVTECLRRNQVISLRSLPHTPQHNAWVERGHGEHQLEMGLEGRVLDLAAIRAVLARATAVLDGCRLRTSRGSLTANQVDLALPPAAGVISRAVFYETACQAIARAVAGLSSARERRRAEREAVLATLQSFGVIIRTRGGVLIPLAKCALIT